VPGVRIEMVLISSVVEETVQVETPEALLEEQELRLLFDPLTAIVGTIPESAVPSKFFNVIVMVEVDEPLASAGPETVIVEWLGLGVLAENSTMSPEIKSTGVK
jgi:hypothetical protein